MGSPRETLESGAVYVYSGKRGVLLRTLDSNRSPSFGRGVVDAGDQNADGVPDLAISSPSAIDRGGWIEIRSGADGHLVRTLDAPANSRGFAERIENVGDVDRDGFDDFLAIARIGTSNDSSFLLLSGASGLLLDVLPGSQYSPAEQRPMCRLGDVDCDGVPDFAIRLADKVQIRSGRDRRVLHVFASPSKLTDASYSFSICDAGDADDDGYADLAIGGPGELGDACPLGSVAIFSGRDGVELHRYIGTRPRTGYALASADGRGGGNRKIFITSNEWIPPSGAVIAIAASTGSVVWEKDYPDPDGYRPEIGKIIASGRDVDGDGVADFVTGRFSLMGGGGYTVIAASGVDGKILHEFWPPEESRR